MKITSQVLILCLLEGLATDSVAQTRGGSNRQLAQDQEAFSGILTLTSSDWDFVENSWADQITVEGPGFNERSDAILVDLLREVLGSHKRGCALYSIDESFFGPRLDFETEVTMDGVPLTPNVDVDLKVDAGFGSLSELTEHANSKTKMECHGDLCNFDLKSTASVKVNMKKWLGVDVSADVPGIKIDDFDLFTLHGAIFMIQCPATNWISILSLTRKLAQKKNIKLTREDERFLRRLVVQGKKQSSGRSLTEFGYGADVDNTPEFVFSCPRWRQDSSISTSTFSSTPFVYSPLAISFQFPALCPGIDLNAYLFSALQQKFLYGGGFGSAVTHVEPLKRVNVACNTTNTAFQGEPVLFPNTDQFAGERGGGYTYVVGVGCGVGINVGAIPPDPDNPFPAVIPVPTAAPRPT